MSDEQRELGRDANASTDGSRTDQHPAPSYTAPSYTAPSYTAPSYTPPSHTAPSPVIAGPGEPTYSATQQIPVQQIPAHEIPAHEMPAQQPHGGHEGSAYPPPPGGPYAGPPAAMPEKPRKQRTMAGIVAAALIAGIVGGGAGFGGAYALLDNGGVGQSTTLGAVPASSNAVNAAPGSVTAAAQAATPSTVDIRVTMAQGTAEGSGVILTAAGDVLTNNHVVAGSTGDIEVTLSDGTQQAATVVGTSPSYDLAVIRLQDVSGLTPATLGESTAVQVGQPVVAIGSPQGLTGTVTTGIVSALNRTVQVEGEDGAGVVYNGLQTDAPINQGNSGGPLVNLDGQVVGINSAIATGGSQSTGSIGLGFAIPVDQARRVAQEIMDSGTATKPLLGVQSNSSASSSAVDGAPLTVVTEGSPAAAAGLTAGDVVTQVGDARVENFSDLIARIGAYSPGQQVPLTVTDGNGGAPRTVDVTLGSQPDQGATTSSGGQSSNPNPFGSNPFGENSPFGGGN